MYFRSFLNKHPQFHKYLRKLRFTIWRNKVAFRNILRNVNIIPDQLIWVDTHKIIKAGVGWGKYIKLHEAGKIVRGNWDLNTMPFEELDVYRSLKARFIDKVKWEDTSYYKGILSQVNIGNKLYGVSDGKDLAERLNYIDHLFDEIQKYGYKTQQESLHDSSSLRILDEITVRIARDGEILFEDGRHRLAIAKILGLQKIPVMVTWRHKEWVLFRAQILDYAHRHEGKIYQPITHPDLSDIPAAHSDIRFNFIKSNLNIKSGSILDIGANWGYFCHRFEEEGFHCYAVEKGSEDFYFLNKLKIAEKRQFAAIHSDIFDLYEKSEFDIVLALNIFHHFLKTSDEYEKLVNFLRKLSAKIMFFEPHLPNEPQMQGAYHNLDNNEFVKFVAENTGLTNWDCIGFGEEGRPIYRLTKT
jgi:2-polyprenyl-3-methyl-5-hydroxy-6-metoxy-1,4-benzoquinol methylase